VREPDPLHLHGAHVASRAVAPEPIFILPVGARKGWRHVSYEINLPEVPRARRGQRRQCVVRAADARGTRGLVRRGAKADARFSRQACGDWSSHRIGPTCGKQASADTRISLVDAGSRV
jgi:hypothetical protein